MKCGVQGQQRMVPIILSHETLDRWLLWRKRFTVFNKKRHWSADPPTSDVVLEKDPDLCPFFASLAPSTQLPHRSICISNCQKYLCETSVYHFAHKTRIQNPELVSHCSSGDQQEAVESIAAVHMGHEGFLCRRRACRKADSPSMMSRMATVRVAKAEKMMDRPKNPPPLREDRPRCITMDHRTSDSSAYTYNDNYDIV
ncbi:hypothetical protein INR49_003716 [Caranx melampygus]|nr:hypothetical protein INR49_003716 [Caranx melampygus]